MVSKCMVVFLAFVVAVNCLPAPGGHHHHIVGYEHHVVKVPVKVIQEHHVLLKNVHVPIYGGRIVHHDPHHHHHDHHHHDDHHHGHHHHLHHGWH